MNIVDRLSVLLGHVSAWLYFTMGAMIGYEVAARYFFNAPTIWAAEVSQLLLIRGTFLAMAHTLRHNRHIRIEMVVARLGPRARAAMQALSLSFIGILCVVVVWYGWDIAWDSVQRDRSTGTMLNIPNWWTQMAIPAGFGVLLLQTLVELWRLYRSPTGKP